MLTSTIFANERFLTSSLKKSHSSIGNIPKREQFVNHLSLKMNDLCDWGFERCPFHSLMASISKWANIHKIVTFEIHKNKWLADYHIHLCFRVPVVFAIRLHSDDHKPQTNNPERQTPPPQKKIIQPVPHNPWWSLIKPQVPRTNPSSRLLFPFLPASLLPPMGPDSPTNLQWDLDIRRTDGGVAPTVMRWAVAASPEAQTPAKRRVDWAVRGPYTARCTQLSRCWQKVILRPELAAGEGDRISISPVKVYVTACSFSSRFNTERWIYSFRERWGRNLWLTLNKRH